MSPRPASRTALLLAAALLLPACFQDPVEERLELRFRADGAVETEALVRIRPTDDFVDDRAVRERVERVRAELAETGLGWPARIERLEPERRRFVDEYRGERLVERRFQALVAEPERLQRLLGDSLVRLLLEDADGGRRELVLLVEPGSRASRRQQDAVASTERRVAAAYLDYIEAAAELNAYLEETPGRAEALLFHVLGGESGLFADGRGEPELTEDEELVVGPVTDAMDAVLSAFGTVPEGEEHSIEELSRLVHDPFAFDLVLRLPTPAESVEGFLVSDDGATLRVPRYSLAEAIERCSVRWLEPDWLIVLWSGPWQREGLLLDLTELAARPRRAEPPAGADELREALRESLRPPDLLRVRWQPPRASRADELDWEARAQR